MLLEMILCAALAQTYDPIDTFIIPRGNSIWPTARQAFFPEVPFAQHWEEMRFELEITGLEVTDIIKLFSGIDVYFEGNTLIVENTTFNHTTCEGGYALTERPQNFAEVVYEGEGIIEVVSTEVIWCEEDITGIAYLNEYRMPYYDWLWVTPNRANTKAYFGMNHQTPICCIEAYIHKDNAPNWEDYNHFGWWTLGWFWIWDLPQEPCDEQGWAWASYAPGHIGYNFQGTVFELIGDGPLVLGRNDGCDYEDGPYNVWDGVMGGWWEPRPYISWMTCAGDFNGDGTVDTRDVNWVIAQWGDPFGTEDFLDVIALWGDCP